jgi:phospholipase C
MAVAAMVGATAAQAADSTFVRAFGAAASAARTASNPFGPFKRVVIIYEENHSFDNLYGHWGSVGSDTVNGTSSAPAAKTIQVRQDSVTAYGCLLQDDVNLTSPTPLATTCNDNGGSPAIASHFTNAPFKIDDFIPASATTCPAPGVFATNGVPNGQGLPGGCTRDLVHRYYNEQYQIDGGKQDRYVTASDAEGLSMGYYDSTQLPIYAYLHGPSAPHYIVADNYFQGAFGGSFLNHQWLIAAASPVWAGALNDGSANDLHSVLDANGMPTSTTLYASPIGSAAKDQQITQSCSPGPGRGALQPAFVCGDYAVNTSQPYYQPYSPGTILAKRLPPLTTPTIGDRLTAAGISWAWYSGGWSNADGEIGAPGWTNGSKTSTSCQDPNASTTAIFPNCPDKNFQFHHQAFNYFQVYAPGTDARRIHLRDEAEFITRAQKGNLPIVSFVKPIGEENEHPGYTSEPSGSSHLVDLLNAIFSSKQGKNTLVIVTYDEFGGQWDHVPPPGFGTDGPHDQWGPGTRVPALLVSPLFKHSAVDHIEHDTTSILATIETMFGLQPLGPRDGAVTDFLDATTVRALTP